MKSYRILVVAIFAAFLMTTSTRAADASPMGTWRWTQPARFGNPSTERMLTILVKDEKLIGRILGHQGPLGQIPDRVIRDASFRNGAISFNVEVKSSDGQFFINYAGKLEGDSIKGTIERPSINGGAPIKIDWLATRVR